MKRSTETQHANAVALSWIFTILLNYGQILMILSNAKDSLYSAKIFLSIAMKKSFSQWH